MFFLFNSPFRLSVISGFKATDHLHTPASYLALKVAAKKTSDMVAKQKYQDFYSFIFIFTFDFSNLALSTDFCFDLLKLHKKCFNTANFFSTTSKTFRNVELAIFAWKQMLFSFKKIEAGNAIISWKTMESDQRINNIWLNI